MSTAKHRIIKVKSFGVLSKNQLIHESDEWYLQVKNIQTFLSPITIPEENRTIIRCRIINKKTGVVHGHTTRDYRHLLSYINKK